MVFFCLAFGFYSGSGANEPLGSLSLQFPASFGHSVLPPGIPQGFVPSSKVINGSQHEELNSTINFQTPQKLTFILRATNLALTS